jgi:glycosyltransferase involved in cell wall biosynthesis
LDRAFLNGNPPSDKIAEARAAFPPGKVVAGTFCRKVKITPAFIVMMERALASCPNLHWVVGGNGDNSYLNEVARREPFASQISIIKGHVDLAVYGRAIDFLVDTFPFVGGNTVHEMAFHGTPVLSMLVELFREFQIQTRDPELLVGDIDAYVSKIQRLVVDPEYLNKRREATRNLAFKLTETESAARDLALLVEGLYDELAGRLAASGV